MKTVLLIHALCVSLLADCQLVIENYLPQSILTSDFIGSNYQLSNITYTGSLEAIGMFDGSNSNLGLADGIVLTTGTVLNNGSGPQGPNNNAEIGVYNTEDGDPVLTAIAGAQSYDAAILEFDFIPSIDSIGFQFVFGSEEYPEYVGSNFSDIVTILISGIPGQLNIARTPDNAPVNVNSINSTTNSSYYVSNGDGNQAPQNQSDYYIQYDGFTVPLLAKYTSLQIGMTYHLKFAIADVSDGYFDSGLFLGKCGECGFHLGLEAEKEDDKKVIGAYDLMGRTVEKAYNGLVIVHYSDGSSKKIYQGGF